MLEPKSTPLNPENYDKDVLEAMCPEGSKLEQKLFLPHAIILSILRDAGIINNESVPSLIAKITECQDEDQLAQQFKNLEMYVWRHYEQKIAARRNIMDELRDVRRSLTSAITQFCLSYIGTPTIYLMEEIHSYCQNIYSLNEGLTAAIPQHISEIELLDGLVAKLKKIEYSSEVLVRLKDGLSDCFVKMFEFKESTNKYLEKIKGLDASPHISNSKGAEAFVQELQDFVGLVKEQRFMLNQIIENLNKESDVGGLESRCENAKYQVAKLREQLLRDVSKRIIVLTSLNFEKEIKQCEELKEKIEKFDARLKEEIAKEPSNVPIELKLILACLQFSKEDIYKHIDALVAAIDKVNPAIVNCNKIKTHVQGLLSENITFFSSSSSDNSDASDASDADEEKQENDASEGTGYSSS